MSSIAKEVIWLRHILMDFGISVTTPTPVYGDNQSAIKIAGNPVFYERTKHLEVALHFVRYHYLAGTVSLPYLASTLQITDLFTKAHTLSRFYFLLGKLSVYDSP